MKFKMLGAALSLTAAFGLMACGDDSSSNAGSGDGTSCEVNVNGNVVTMTTTVAGTTSKQIWTLDTDKDEVTISYEPEVAGQQPMSMPAAGATVDLYKQTAEGLCKAMEEAEPVNPGKDNGDANGYAEGDGDGNADGDGDADGDANGYEYPDKLDECNVSRKGDVITTKMVAEGITMIYTKMLQADGIMTETVTFSGKDAQKAYESACVDAKKDDPDAKCDASTKTVTDSYEEEDFEDADQVEAAETWACEIALDPEKAVEDILGGDGFEDFESLCAQAGADCQAFASED